MTAVAIHAAAAYSTWCGKYYELGAADIPPSPDSHFHYPLQSPRELLDFRCTAASSVYVSSDAPAIIVDAEINWLIGDTGGW